jgi:hypothetical protein
MFPINAKKSDENSPDFLFLLTPQVRLELTTLRLTAECSAIELLRKTPFCKANKFYTIENCIMQTRKN